MKNYRKNYKTIGSLRFELAGRNPQFTTRILQFAGLLLVFANPNLKVCLNEK